MNKEVVIMEKKSPRIVYHVKSTPEYFVTTQKTFDSIVNESIESISKSLVLGSLIMDGASSKEVSEYVLTSFNRKLKKGMMSGALSHTVAFEYDSEIDSLFIGWAKPREFETISKKLGYTIANARIDRMKKFGSEYFSASVGVPSRVTKTIEKMMPRVRSYFKQMTDKTSVVCYSGPQEV
jgi:hypothetical protein